MAPVVTSLVSQSDLAQNAGRSQRGEAV